MLPAPEPEPAEPAEPGEGTPTGDSDKPQTPTHPCIICLEDPDPSNELRPWQTFGCGIPSHVACGECAARFFVHAAGTNIEAFECPGGRCHAVVLDEDAVRFMTPAERETALRAMRASRARRAMRLHARPGRGPQRWSRGDAPATTCPLTLEGCTGHCFLGPLEKLHEGVANATRVTMGCACKGRRELYCVVCQEHVGRNSVPRRLANALRCSLPTVARRMPPLPRAVAVFGAVFGAEHVCADANDAHVLELLRNTPLNKTKPCPRCLIPIFRSEGCRNMNCSRCRAAFCWDCLRSSDAGHDLFCPSQSVVGDMFWKCCEVVRDVGKFAGACIVGAGLVMTAPVWYPVRYVLEKRRAKRTKQQDNDFLVAQRLVQDGLAIYNVPRDVISLLDEGHVRRVGPHGACCMWLSAPSVDGLPSLRTRGSFVVYVHAHDGGETCPAPQVMNPRAPFLLDRPVCNWRDAPTSSPASAASAEEALGAAVLAGVALVREAIARGTAL